MEVWGQAGIWAKRCGTFYAHRRLEAGNAVPPWHSLVAAEDQAGQDSGNLSNVELAKARQALLLSSLPIHTCCWT